MEKEKEKQPHTTLCSLYLGMLAPPPFPVRVYHWPVSKQATPILQPYPVHSNLANSSSPFISACLALVSPQPSHAPFLTQAAGDWWTLGKVKSYWWLLGKVNSYWWMLGKVKSHWWILGKANCYWWMLGKPNSYWWFLERCGRGLYANEM